MSEQGLRGEEGPPPLFLSLSLSHFHGLLASVLHSDSVGIDAMMHEDAATYSTNIKCEKVVEVAAPLAPCVPRCLEGRVKRTALR